MPNAGTTPSGLWLDVASLAKRCDPEVFGRALELFRAQRVLSLRIAPVSDYWELDGHVQGSARKPYEVNVELKRSFNGQVLEWDSHCSCPVGEQCKHGVALLIRAAYRGQHILQEAGVKSGQRPPSAEELAALRRAEEERQQAAALREAEKSVQSWIRELDRVVHPVTEDDTRSVNAWRKTAAPKQEFFLYLVSVGNKYGQRDHPQLVIEVVSSYIKNNGDWAKAKIMRYTPERGQPIYDQATETDRDLLQLLRALPAATQYSYYGYNQIQKVCIDGKFGQQALQMAASTGRLFIGDERSQPVTPLTLGPDRVVSWQWHEVTLLGQAASHWTPKPHFDPPGAQLCLNNPPLYLDAARGQCGLADLQGLMVGQAAVLMRTPALRSEALKKFQTELSTLLGPVPMPPVVEPLATLKDIAPVARLHLRPVAPDQVQRNGLLLAQLRFDYAGYIGWWVGQGALVLMEAGPQGRVMLQRDPQAELEAIIALRDMGFASDGRDQFGLIGDDTQQRWLQLMDADFAPLRQAGFEISLDPALQGWIAHAEALQVELTHDGEDEAASPWFDLSLGMEINGQRHNILPLLPGLIAAAAQSPRDATTGLPELPHFVYLARPEGGFVRLPTDNLKPWMGALLELVGERAHDMSGESLRLSRFDALRTTAALGEGAVWSGAQHLRELVQQLKGQSVLPTAQVPATVQAELRPYQQQGLNWLQFLREHQLAGILADDMGLGKTLQTLVHIQIEKDAGRLTAPALIVAPVSLMGNWRREAERFCPGLSTLVLHGAERHEQAVNMAERDVVIAPYSLLHRDRERWLATTWHMLVLDEAQNIKNANTHAAQVVGELRARHRLCLSGTPMENNLGELWSLFHFLMPGFLGSQRRFNELFRKPIEKQGDPQAARQLRARVTPFMLRRTKALVASELPPKVESVMPVELTGKQADLYETIRLGMEKTVREALQSKGLAKSQITILDALLKLRQVCCDPRLLKLDAAKKVKTSAKLEQLMELLPEMLAEGRRILLFSQFTSMLTLIEAELKARNLRWVKLTGQSLGRDALIEQFTSGAVPLFLISLKAGGVGLNLPQADTVIHYDPWWNPAAENQATDRAHRIGQTQSVWVMKLVAQGTIEERILALQERKAALADNLYSDAVGRKQALFTEGDLEELLKPLSG